MIWNGSVFRNKNGERGLTFVEQMITLLVVGLVVLAWINVYRFITKGSLRSKSNLRAQNLCMTKLEDVKALVTQLSQASSFTSVTYNALTQAYATTQTASFDNKAFTWRVLTNYATVGLNGGPVTSTASTNMVEIFSEVYWSDDNLPFSLTMTGYVSNLRD